jgi:hypothetical protein
MKSFIFQSALLLFAAQIFAAGDYYGKREAWLQKAEANRPTLVITEKRPVSTVNIIANPQAFQQWEALKTSGMDSLFQSAFKAQSGVVVDFGEHVTGYVDISIDVAKGTPDAPLRFKCTFGEVPAEMAMPFDPYTGGLSRAWLQDEVFTAERFPVVVNIPRRLSFRYLKIELLGSSPWFDVRIKDIVCRAQTSAKNQPAALPATVSPALERIDRVGLRTLKECMQTVYEDGVKRDQRLWLGDLYLESLANNYSYRQFDVTRRCLYLFAGVSDSEGFLPANVFEKPEPHPQEGQYFLDYALLFNVTLKDYLEASADRETVVDLWPVARRQLDIIYRYLSPDGLMNYDRAVEKWTVFFDWNEALYKGIALQGIAIYALEETYALAKSIGQEKEVANLPALIKKMRRAARKCYYNPRTGLFLDSDHGQVSYTSQVWMVLGGVVAGVEAQQALKVLETLTGAGEPVCKPGTPYAYHYYVQALVNTGLTSDARRMLDRYWGGMVDKGADTFWEVYDPDNEFLSPYGFYPMNSYCHAWSCTPVYFIRNYESGIANCE